MCFEGRNKWFNYFSFVCFQVLALNKSLVCNATGRAHTQTHKETHTQTKENVPALCSLIYRHICTCAHTQGHTVRHTKREVLFLKVEKAINGILLNRRTRATNSPLHWRTTNLWLFRAMRFQVDLKSHVKFVFKSIFISSTWGRALWVGLRPEDSWPSPGHYSRSALNSELRNKI